MNLYLILDKSILKHEPVLGSRRLLSSTLAYLAVILILFSKHSKAVKALRFFSRRDFFRSTEAKGRCCPWS